MRFILFFILAILLHFLLLFPFFTYEKEAQYSIKSGIISIQLFPILHQDEATPLSKQSKHQTQTFSSLNNNGSSSNEATPLGNIAPEYPVASRKLGEEGITVLIVEINNKGFVTDVKIQSSSGYKRLDTATIETLRKAQFSPATVHGLGVNSSKILTIKFELR